MNEWIGVYIYLGCFSFLMGMVLTRLFIRISKKINFVDNPGKRKIHSDAMPLLGGVSIFFTLMIVVLFHLSLVYWGQDVLMQIVSEKVLEFLPGIFHISHKIGIWLVCSMVIFMLGVLDDKINLHAGVKFIIQSMVAIFFIAQGHRITVFIEYPLICQIITFLWIVGITNAFNLLDNMDGLSGGIALIASFFLLLISISMNEYFISGFLAVLMGSICAFLYFNFNPARIFMGDSGSMFIGFLLSTISIFSTFYYHDNATIYTVAMPLFIFSIPLYDTASVIWIRIKERRPIYKGDNSHFSHRLVQLGMSRKGAVLFICLIALMNGISAVLLSGVKSLGAFLLLTQLVLTMLILALLEHFVRLKNKNNS